MMTPAQVISQLQEICAVAYPDDDLNHSQVLDVAGIFSQIAEIAIGTTQQPLSEFYMSKKQAGVSRGQNGLLDRLIEEGYVGVRSKKYSISPAGLRFLQEGGGEDEETSLLQGFREAALGLRPADPTSLQLPRSKTPLKKQSKANNRLLEAFIHHDLLQKSGTKLQLTPSGLELGQAYVRFKEVIKERVQRVEELFSLQQMQENLSERLRSLQDSLGIGPQEQVQRAQAQIEGFLQNLQGEIQVQSAREALAIQAEHTLQELQSCSKSYEESLDVVLDEVSQTLQVVEALDKQINEIRRQLEREQFSSHEPESESNHRLPKKNVPSEELEDVLFGYLGIVGEELRIVEAGHPLRPKKLLKILERYSRQFVGALELERVGAPGDEVEFNEELHSSRSPLRPGQVVRVIRSGWRREGSLLRKVEVTGKKR